MGTGGSRYGAGRPGWHGKAEHCLRLDIRQRPISESIRAGSAGSWHWTDSDGDPRGSISFRMSGRNLELSYSLDGSPRGQTVPIVKTPCHLGGNRPWFICPVRGERVAVLFMRAGRFACRHCQRVAYSSQSDDTLGRAWRKQSKAESRLGDNWRRPKGMREATYNRLLTVILDCERWRDEQIAGYLESLAQRYPSLRGDFGL